MENLWYTIGIAVGTAVSLSFKCVVRFTRAQVGRNSGFDSQTERFTRLLYHAMVYSKYSKEVV